MSGSNALGGYLEWGLKNNACHPPMFHNTRAGLDSAWGVTEAVPPECRTSWYANGPRRKP
eukprot:2995804-Pyramimonas_sp.AAC.1